MIFGMVKDSPCQIRKIIHTTEYLASIACIGCLGTGLAGGAIPGTPPEWPPAINLTPGGNLSQWDEAKFIQMSDEDLGSLWAYLQSLPAKETGTR